MLDIAEGWIVVALTVPCFEKVVGRWGRWVTYTLVSRPKLVRAFWSFFSLSEKARYGHLLLLPERHSPVFPNSGIVIVAKYLALPTLLNPRNVCTLTGCHVRLPGYCRLPKIARAPRQCKQTAGRCQCGLLSQGYSDLNKMSIWYQKKYIYTSIAQVGSPEAGRLKFIVRRCW